MKDKWLKQIEDAHKRLLKAFDLAPDDVKILGTMRHNLQVLENNLIGKSFYEI